MTMTVEDAVSEQQNSVDDRPHWLRALGAKYSSLQAHAFLLHGSIFDYEVPAKSLRPFIAEVLSPKFPVCVTYSSGRGFSFSNDDSLKVFMQFMAVAGFGEVQPQALEKVVPEQAIPLLLQFLASTDKHSTVGIIDRLDFIAGPSCSNATILESLHNAGTDKALEDSQNILIMLTPELTGVSPEILRASSGIYAIDMQLPDTSERLRYIHDRIRMKNGVILPKPIIKLAMLEESLAAATSGLSRRNIEDVLLAGHAQGEVTWEVVNERTAEIISTEAAGLLKVVKPQLGSESLGGMTHWKSWKDRWIIKLARSSDPKQRKAMPKVLLFVGPPGTGKTEAAYALGKDIDWNVLEMEQIKDSLVGGTEKNLGKIKSILRSRKPYLLFIDEIDQWTGRVTGGTGSGGESVDKSVFRFILMLLNDESLRGEGLIVMASNNPVDIDGAVLDRCDAIVPFLPAETPEARADILSRMMLRKGVLVGVNKLEAVGSMLDERWSGRDMSALVAKAYGLMQMDNIDPVAALKAAAKTRKPQQREDTRLMIEWAKAYSNDLDLLPEQYRDHIADKRELDREIAQARGRSFASSRDI